MTPDFQSMSKAELKAYVLTHRDDPEAARYFFSRRTPGDKNKHYPPLSIDGVPIEENIRIMQEAIRQRLESGDSEK